MVSRSMKRRVLICGCGYVGIALGRLLVSEGHTVFGLRRTAASLPELAAEGISPLLGDISRPADLESLPGPFDWVVHVASSTGGGLDEYRSVYLDGLQHLLAWLNRAHDRPSRLVYTSSTSVYGQTDGSWVDETSPTNPTTETGAILVAAEQLLRTAPLRVHATTLRVAGIYGPGRGHLFRQFVAGKISPPDAPARWLNMVHRDDVATAIRAALETGTAGGIYNVADNEPVLATDFLNWIAAQLGRDQSRFGTGSSPTRLGKRAETHKQVSNRLIRDELQWSPAFPTFREGYADAIRSVKAGHFTP